MNPSQERAWGGAIRILESVKDEIDKENGDLKAKVSDLEDQLADKETEIVTLKEKIQELETA